MNAEAGFGLGTLTEADAAASIERAQVRATGLDGSMVVLNNGCFSWKGSDDADGAWLVWPDGAKVDSQDGARVVLPSGETASADLPLTVTGAVISLEDLPDGGDPNSYFGSYGGFCGAEERGVLVFTSVKLRG